MTPGLAFGLLWLALFIAAVCSLTWATRQDQARGTHSAGPFESPSEADKTEARVWRFGCAVCFPHAHLGHPDSCRCNHCRCQYREAEPLRETFVAKAARLNPALVVAMARESRSDRPSADADLRRRITKAESRYAKFAEWRACHKGRMCSDLGGGCKQCDPEYFRALNTDYPYPQQ